jgi:hypothetical protein
VSSTSRARLDRAPPAAETRSARTDRDALPEVLPGVPVRDVLAELEVGREDRADRTLLEQLHQSPEAWVEAQLVADEAGEACTVDGLDQLADALLRVAERLFEQQVAAGLGRGERDRHVLGGRVCGNDGVGAVCQRTLEVVEGGDAVLLERIAGPHTPVRADHELLPAHPVGGQLDVVSADGAQVRGMALADAPEPDDQDLQSGSNVSFTRG